jgi:hypothetical protein
MPKGYTTRQQIENYLLITIDPTFYAQVNSWIEQMEKYIDQLTGRNFVADAVATERLFDGNNANIFPLDDCISITKVEQGDGSISVASSIWTALIKDEDYMEYPANHTADGLPISEIRYLGGVFYRGFQNIKVKAKWGYSVAAPTDIITVATILVAGIINYSLNAEGEVKSMSIGRYTVTYKDEKSWQDFDRIKGILEYYKKYDL